MSWNEVVRTVPENKQTKHKKYHSDFPFRRGIPDITSVRRPLDNLVLFTKDSLVLKTKWFENKVTFKEGFFLSESLVKT